MSAPYAGNPALYPATIPVLDDADPRAAATWAPAIEGLADRTAHIKRYAVDDIYLWESESTATPEVLVTATDGAPGLTVGSITIPHADADDMLHISFSGVLNGKAACAGDMYVQVTEDADDTAVAIEKEGSRRWYVSPADDAYGCIGAPMRHEIVTAGEVVVRLQLVLRIGTGGGGSLQAGDILQILKGASMTVIHRGAGE